MRIEELLIAGFGRLQGRRLRLAPGLNLVYGPNESGKTTLQTFLLAMLYGMQKRGAKRAYSEEADRYRPWGGAEYRGTLIYATDDGRRYRVEREFTRGRDRAAVFDAETGADLSARFEQDRRKELLFAAAHLGLDEETFRSTAWVGQMAVGRLDLGRELVARVANLQESGREDLSVKAALGALDEHSKAIGSERTPARPYGRVLRALADKREALERAQGAREQVRGWEGRLQETRAVLAELEEELDEARRRLDWALCLEAEERSQRVARGMGRVDELQARVRELAPYADFPSDQLPRLRRVLVDADDATQQAGVWQERAAAFEAEAAAVRSEAGSVPAGAGGGSTAALVGAVLLVAAAGAAGAMGAWVPAGVAALLAVGALVWWLVARNQATAAYRQARAAAEVRLRVLRDEQESARRRAEAEQERASQAAAEAAAILKAAGVKDAAAFEAAALKREAWQKARDEAGALAAVVGAQAGEDWGARAAGLRARVRGERPAHLASSEALQAEVRRLEVRQADLTNRASDLGARVETALAEVPDTADLRRELEALAEQKAAYDEELAATELAVASLTAVAGEMHREFAPRLNRALGQVAAGLTGGRYRAVRVDEAASIRVITADERTVDITSLSGGTIDQLYLGLRLALLDLLTGGQESVPLFLDDPFVQYDDERAAEAMAFLEQAARDRQILLMTCHRRELTRALASGAHIIDLSEVAG